MQPRTVPEMLAKAAVVLYAALLVVGGVTVEGEPPSAADRLIDAWRGYRSGTFTAEFTTVRERGETRMELPGRLVQQPPQRIETVLDHTSAVIGGAHVECDATRCRTGEPVGWDALVEAEVDEFAVLVTGRVPPYDVVFDDGCFFLLGRIRVTGSPFGQAAQLCFDAGTGALRRVVVDHGDVLETTTYTVSADVDMVSFEL
jgi:hypothetical protein